VVNSINASSFEELTPPDKRKKLEMTQAMKEFQFHNMRQSLELTTHFILALQKKNYEILEKLAVGFGVEEDKKKLSQAIIKRNPSFKGMAMAHKKASAKLIKVVHTKDDGQILKQLGLVLKTCVQCHSTYKTVVVP
jgi:hypothetical protein